MEVFLIIFFSYISGSVPFGLILTKISSGKDIRKVGSGNIGATNVLRTGNKYLAASTLFLDTLKGYIPVMLTSFFSYEYIFISALSCFLGHVFSIWLNFKGGKGVATYLGILIAFSYALGILFIFTWLILFLIFKYSSISSIFSSLTIFVTTFIRETAQNANPDIISNIRLSNILFILLILIIFTHKKNIINLKNKTEPKIKL
jgi:acyl phosphate:glycerol-3-phosphate acyltransferase